MKLKKPTFRLPSTSQLAVCKGLVLDRLHHLKSNSSALQTRRCRASYGIVFTPLTTRQDKGEKGKGKHRKQSRFFNDRKPKSPATTSSENNDKKIHWLIKRDEPVRVVQCNISRVVDSVDPRSVWADEIIFSTLPKSDLPTHMPKPSISKQNVGGPRPAQTIALLESNLASLPPNQVPPPFAPFDRGLGSSPRGGRDGDEGGRDGSGGTYNRYNDNYEKPKPKPDRLSFLRSSFPFMEIPPLKQTAIDFEVSVSIGPGGLEFRSWLFSGGGGGRGGDGAGDNIVGGSGDGADSVINTSENEVKENSEEGKVMVGERYIKLNWNIFPDEEESQERGEDVEKESMEVRGRKVWR
jgi:hypothetical protein